VEGEDAYQCGQRLVRESDELGNVPLSQRAAWAIGHEKELTDCVRNLLRYHDGYAAQHQTLTQLAAALLSAIEPLFSAKGEFKYWLEGTAPRLRSTCIALKLFLAPRDGANH